MCLPDARKTMAQRMVAALERIVEQNDEGLRAVRESLDYQREQRQGREEPRPAQVTASPRRWVLVEAGINDPTALVINIGDRGNGFRQFRARIEEQPD